MSRLCGIDGCRDGWVIVTLDTHDATLSARVLKTAELAALDYDLAGIDVPIGLIDKGQRPADQAARRYLGWPRTSSVFPTPIRPALHATSWEQACEITAGVDGRRRAQRSNRQSRLRQVRLEARLLQRNRKLRFPAAEQRPFERQELSKSSAAKDRPSRDLQRTACAAGEVRSGRAGR